MNKKSIRLISLVITTVLVVMALSTAVFAIDIGGVDVVTNVEDVALGNVTKTGNKILTTIRTVGVLVSVGVIMILGIKYMAGSAEEKASYKKTMVPFFIGAILLFAASILVETVYNFATGL